MILVLRYSSYRSHTITEHEQLLADRGSVWWGWWKKHHEPWPGERLASLTTPCEIGLVDRAAEEYYLAKCVQIASANGDPMPSPLPVSTPDYYSDDHHPLWLKFTGIEKLDLATWERRFGATPAEDETLYLRDSVDQSTNMSSVEVVEAKAPDGRMGVLHLSDLHFGDDHAYVASAHTERMELVEQVSRALPEKPAAVIVSGDLTTRGDQNGLTLARKFLEELAKRFQLDPENFVIVPGNHDILVDNVAHVKNMINEQNYRDFTTDFYGVNYELERVHSISLSNGTKLLFGTSNSSKYRADVFMDYGYVGWDRIEPVMSKLEQLSGVCDAHTFYVLHHHLQSAFGNEEPTPERPVSVTLDAGDLVSLAAKHQVKALVHGHQHLPFIGSLGRLAEVNRHGASRTLEDRRVMTLGAGSLSVQGSRLSDDMRNNSFSFYSPSAGQLRVRVFELTPTRSPGCVWDFEVPF